MRFSHGAAAFLTALVLPSCSGDEPFEAPAPVPEKAAPPRSGKEVYMLLCATCHGETGDGKGVAQLDRPARSFLDGGFSFGNTKEALYRTVSNGIGGTPMPGFAAALSEEERRRVVDYVISLGPERPPEAGDAAILEVGDRPVVVRGQFHPLASGQAPITRGVLVGTLDGLSWLYDASDVRLLAVRQGSFVKRTDWSGRGGTPLELLGKPVHRSTSARPAFSRTDSSSPLRARLRSTRLDGAHAWVRYELLDDTTKLATLRERGEAFGTLTFSGYRRRFEVTDGGSGTVAMELSAAPAGESFVGKDGTHWTPTQDGDRWVVYGVRVDGREDASAIARDHGLAARLDLGRDLRWTVTTLVLPDAKPESLAKLKEEA